MPLWRRSLVHAFYAATYPYRALAAQRQSARGQAPVALVLYHRVDNDWANLWTISRVEFERQIDWLERHYDLVDFEEAQRRIRCGYNERPTVHVTFDDGYAVNCEHAIPLLVKRQIPCTYFVTIDHVMSGEPFSHDLEHGNQFAPNTIEQLRAMADSGIEIGAHTATHADIGQMDDKATMYREIVESAERLRDALERPVRYFAFPFGRRECLHPAAIQMCYDAGFEAVVSAYGGRNMPGGDSYHLTRLPVDGPLIRLKNWMTGDPRRRLEPYEYTLKDKSAEPLGVPVT
jgi:peptidoglycan/xylan/chitin deacetylase (PgdA/CDA1 family)